MKYLILIILFSCNIITAMKEQQTIILDDFKTHKIGDRIFASAQEKSTQKRFSFEKDTKNGTSYCFYIKPVKNKQIPGFNTQGFIYEEITKDRPDIHSAFEREINNFQQTKPSLKNTETKDLKNPKIKSRSLVRRASSFLPRKHK